MSGPDVVLYRDADAQARHEAEIAARQAQAEANGTPPPPSEIEILKRRLQEKADGTLDPAENTPALDMMYAILINDDDFSDDVFKGHQGHYQMGEGYLAPASDVFQDGEAFDSMENVNDTLEMMALGNARFGEEPVHIQCSLGNHTQEAAMMFYAARLAGVNVANEPDELNLSDDLKAKMDQAWADMQTRLGNPSGPMISDAPAISPDAEPDAEPGTDTPDADADEPSADADAPDADTPAADADADEPSADAEPDTPEPTADPDQAPTGAPAAPPPPGPAGP